MKRRLISLLLAVMLLTALPVTAFAATAENVVVKDAAYYGDGSLKSITTAFEWNSAGVTAARLILSSERLKGSYSGKPGYGDFSDAGDIFDLNFKTYSDAQAYDNANGNPYGFIRTSDPMDISKHNITMGLTLPENTISMDEDGTYYIYLWVTYRGRFYPDNLICAIQVQDGKLLYTPATMGYIFRNHYEPKDFTPVSGTNPDNQPDQPDQPTQPTQPNQPNQPIHTCTPSGWKWDDNFHWQWICTTEGCQNYHAQTNRNAHVFTDAYDATCNTCGSTRTAPAQHPDTGDITNIPMWAMLFFGGVALMWVQLAQRKREQF